MNQLNISVHNLSHIQTIQSIIIILPHILLCCVSVLTTAYHDLLFHFARSAEQRISQG